MFEASGADLMAGQQWFGQLEGRIQRAVEELGVANVVWRVKSNYSAPADAHIVDEIRQWDAVVSGIGD